MIARVPPLSARPCVSVRDLNLQTIPIMSHVTISPVSRHSYGSTRGVRETRRNRRQRSVTPRLLDTQRLRAVAGNYATSKATPSPSHPPPPPALIYKRRCLDRCLHAVGESALWVTLTPSSRFTTLAIIDRSYRLRIVRGSYADHEKLLIAESRGGERFTCLHPFRDSRKCRRYRAEATTRLALDGRSSVESSDSALNRTIIVLWEHNRNQFWINIFSIESDDSSSAQNSYSITAY